MKSIHAALLIPVLFSAAAALKASPINFNFITSGGVETGTGLTNVRTYTDPVTLATVTVTGWSVGQGPTDTFSRAQSTFTNGFGLGACSPGTGPTNGVDCSSPYHQIDNNSHYEFLLFQFSPGVSAVSVTLQSFTCWVVTACDATKNGRDSSYFFGTVGSGNLSGVTLGGLGGIGFGVERDNAHTAENSASTDPAVTQAILGTTGNALLFGAMIDGAGAGDDFFKIQTLSANAVPEPATIGMIGVALVAFGFCRRRSRRGQ